MKIDMDFMTKCSIGCLCATVALMATGSPAQYAWLAGSLAVAFLWIRATP